MPSATTIRTRYAVSRTAIIDYAAAIGESHPWCVDPASARQAGYADVVAPPMFVAVYAMPAVKRLQAEVDLGLDPQRLLHGGQRFSWPAGTPVVAGDEICTELQLTGVRKRGRLTFVEYETRSSNQRFMPVSIGQWVAIVPDAATP
jgi:acyl dehydratase